MPKAGKPLEDRLACHWQAAQLHNPPEAGRLHNCITA